MKYKKICVVLILTVLTVSGVILWTIWGNTALMTENITISSQRLPADFSGFRIAHISDLHNTEFGEDNQKLQRRISEGKPDIIVITGDLVDANRINVDIALRFAADAVQTAPVYYVMGNHEACVPQEQYTALVNGLKEAGVTILAHESVQLKRGDSQITLAGLADPTFNLDGEMAGALSDVVKTRLDALMQPKDNFTILLSHRPELFETYAESGIDLVLSGHAHGGQFRIPFIGGVAAPNQGFFPKYDAGLFTRGNTNMIVSRGLGNSTIPMRFNNRPEVVMIELKKK